MKTKSLFLLTALLLMASLLLSACSTSQSSQSPGPSSAQSDSSAAPTSSEQQENDGQADDSITILVATSVNPEVGSPAEYNTVFCLYEMVYEPLVKYGYNGVIEPGLAENWDVSDDGKEYTFFLRQDVKFSDGSDFNADSVIDSASHWDYSSFSSPLVSVDKVDEYTVKLTFEDNCYTVLTELTFPRPYRIASENSFDENGEFVQMIGTGEWMVDSYIAEEEAVMVPNPYYYGQAPNIDQLVIRTVSEGQSRTMALQSGEADLSLASLPAESNSIIESSDNLNFATAEGTMGFFLMLNQENEYLQDENVRMALNYAIDKNSIVNDIMMGTAVAATGILPQTVPYVTAANSEGYPYNLETAKALLADSGYTDSDGDGIVDKDGNPLSLKLVFQTEEYASWKSMCEYMQAAIKEIGIDLQLELLATSAYYDAIWSNREFDLIIYRTYEDSWNPYGFLRSMFYQAEGGQSICWYDSQLNTYLEEVLLTQDEQTRQAKYDEIFKIINDNALVVPLCYPNLQYAYNTRLQNVTVAPTTYESIEWQMITVN